LNFKFFYKYQIFVLLHVKLKSVLESWKSFQNRLSLFNFVAFIVLKSIEWARVYFFTARWPYTHLLSLLHTFVLLLSLALPNLYRIFLYQSHIDIISLATLLFPAWYTQRVVCYSKRVKNL
jgi:hypothetical protein